MLDSGLNIYNIQNSTFPVVRLLDLRVSRPRRWLICRWNVSLALEVSGKGVGVADDLRREGIEGFDQVVEFRRAVGLSSSDPVETSSASVPVMTEELYPHRQPLTLSSSLCLVRPHQPHRTPPASA